MATYNELTAEQKALVDDWQGNLRALLGTLGKVKQWCDTLDGQYNEEVNTLGITGDVPNHSGLAGSSVEEAYTQLQTWQSYLSTFTTNLGTAAHFDQYVSAAGPDNVQGGDLGV